MEEFFELLLSEGRPSLGTDEAPSPADVAAATQFVLDHERTFRLTLTGRPPTPSKGAAAWGARMFYRGAQFFAYRQLAKQALTQELSAPCPELASPSVCYAVDLTFRFLPDLLRLARSAAQHDPLVERLQAWAAEWPLSSVSIAGVTPRSLDGFIDDPSLRMLYIDRILASKDLSRLNDHRVRAAVRGALGAFPERAPEIAAGLTAANK